MNWLEAQLCLAIWNPDLMNFIRNPWRRAYQRLNYKARGNVWHDRALNGAWLPVPSTEKEAA